MPDHLHLVVVASSEGSDLRRFIGLAKQRSAYLFARATGERLWQEEYFEHVVRKDEGLPELVGYILRNPGRAGLVADPVEYPHWGSQVYTREELLAFVGSVRRS
jgi:REP element-mobilizing transposase RayT